MSDQSAEIPSPPPKDIAPPQVPAPEPIDLAKPPHPLARRMMEMRTVNEQRLQTLQAYTQPGLTETEKSDMFRADLPQITKDQLLSENEAIMQRGQNITTIERLLQCNTFLRNAEIYGIQSTDDRIAGIHKSLAQTHKKIAWDEERLAELDKKRGPLRLLNRAERKELEENKEACKRMIEILNEDLSKSASGVKDYAITIRVETVTRERDMALAKLTGEEMLKIRDEYDALFQELAKDKVVTADIQDVFIRDVIEKRLNESSSPEVQEHKDEFINNLKELLAQETQGQETDNKTAVRSIMTSTALRYLVEDDIDKLLGQGKDEVLKYLLGSAAGSQIKEMCRSVESVFEGDALTIFEDYRDRELIIRSDRSDMFVKQMITRLHGDGARGPNRIDMTMWETLKSSPTLQEIAGNEIAQEDQEIYLSAVTRSLWDESGADIELLRHYPTPEAVGTLVLLSGASYKNYRTMHANNVLNTLTARPDWNQLLNATIAQYPQLESARTFFLNWQHVTYGQNPAIHEAIKDFALARYKDFDAGRLVNVLAQDCLTNDILINIQIEGSHLSPEDAEALKKLPLLLGDVASRASQLMVNGDIDTVPRIDQDSIQNKLRGLLLSDGPSSVADHAFKYFAKIARKVETEQHDIPYVQFVVSSDVIDAATTRNIDALLLIPKHARLLTQETMRPVRNYVLNNAHELLTDPSDVEFLGKLLGEFGKRSRDLIQGYKECLSTGEITRADRELVLEFGRQFRVMSPELMKGFKEAKAGGHEHVYFAKLRSLAERMSGSGGISDDERDDPIFKDLLRHVYPDNSERWTTYEKNETCEDRSFDLEGFVIKPRYEIDLLSQSQIRVKTGKTLDTKAQEDVQAPIYSVAEKMKSAGFDNETIKQNLNEQLDSLLGRVAQEGGVELPIASLSTPEEKLFLLLTDSTYGSGVIDKALVKEVLITYEFANFEDINAYISGTNDRVSRASNREYALMCEVNTFYSDRIKEVNRKLVEAGWNNQAISSLMPGYFKKLAEDTQVSQKQEIINRLQVPKLGLTDELIKQMGALLEKKNGRGYTPEQIQEIIRRYEGLTHGMSDTKTTSKHAETRAIYGKLRSIRERTFHAVKELTGEDLDPRTTKLGAVNLQEMMAMEKQIQSGVYDANQFASYTVQRFIDLFDNERLQIQTELDKFESDSGQERETLNGYITKSKESAHARMVGGVCVSGDNPFKNPTENLWDMPNYFQLVLQDPDTLQCQGAVLLHHFTVDGKKILSASLNPSSTYLYSVDPQALFDGLVGSLEVFATDNGFDNISISRNPVIRTNRTGGLFEQAMDRRVAQVNKSFTFDPMQTFSYDPRYQLSEMDIIWENPTEPSTNQSSLV